MEFFDFIEDTDAKLDMAAAVWWMMAATVACLAGSAGGGSLLGKAKITWRDFAGAHTRYMLRYFWPSDEVRPGTGEYGPPQPESAFERRFRMPRFVFDKIFAGVTSTYKY
eukprot:Plantae.Rhodophyta-Palmaria_palmata.ctg812.p1 GENE.Plantae.Rhodophyta-Palmaria_palmata.ctg812~~Plantae.Rhodophyta-Palmaria_palmata.ctg812.p1  ORF type:complete len:110 (-),score=15.15 Plantae.Rhodophyta-Palmaria_palmata.ctg812:317-646(-)